MLKGSGLKYWYLYIKFKVTTPCFLLYKIRRNIRRAWTNLFYPIMYVENSTEPHRNTSLCIGILSCQYGINPTGIVTTDSTWYMYVLEQRPIVWFNCIVGIVYPQWDKVQDNTNFYNIFKGMEQTFVLTLFICFWHFMMNCGDS